MSDFRITWEAPLDTSVVDNIAIFRYNGITQDCSVVLNDGDLVSDTIPVSQTSYDDLGAPELSQVTYAVFSKNAVGYSECALSSESVAPISADAPVGLQTTVLTSIYAPTGLQTQDADITVGPEGITAVWQTSPLYAVDGGHYVYPLFLSEAESNYTDSLNGGSGASHTMVYNGVTYYMPNTGGTHAGTQAPSIGTYFDSGVEIERLDETDEAPRDIVAVLDPGAVAPDAQRGPFAIRAYADIDGDGIYSNEDVDDTDPSVGAAPSNQPTNLSTLTSPDEAPSSLITLASPLAPSGLSTLTNPVESARAPSGLTSAVQQSQGIVPFAAKDINATGAGTVGDGYQKYYDSYSDGDISVDFMWDSANSTLEVTATDTNGVTETIYTYTGTFYDSALGGGGTGEIDTENWYLKGFNDAISGNTIYYPDIRIIKRDGLTYSNLPDGSSFDIRFSSSNPNTYLAANGKNYYYDMEIEQYASNFSFISLNSNENNTTYRKYFFIDPDSNYIPVYRVDQGGTDTAAYAGWSVTETIENNYVVGFTVTNNTGSTVGPSSTPPSVGPTNLSAMEDPSFTNRVYTANTALVNGQDSWVDVDIGSGSIIRVYNSYTGPDGYILTLTNNATVMTRQSAIGYGGSNTVWSSADPVNENIMYPVNFYNDMSFTAVITPVGSNEIGEIHLSYTYPT